MSGSVIGRVYSLRAMYSTEKRDAGTRLWSPPTPQRCQEVHDEEARACLFTTRLEASRVPVPLQSFRASSVTLVSSERSLDSKVQWVL
eukprot:1071339-Rhodomonas_salina.1